MRSRFAGSILIILAFAAAIAMLRLARPADLPAVVQLAWYTCVALLLAAVILRILRAVGSWRRTEEAYRTIFEDASDAIAIAGPQLNILEVNEKACELLGYSRGDLLKMTAPDLVPAGEPVTGLNSLAQELRSGKTVIQERALRRSSGETITAEVSVRRLRDGRLIAIARDVTERRREQEALKESEAVTRSVVYTAVDGIITADDQGTIHLFNTAAERIFGYTAEEVAGKNLSILMPPPHSALHDGYLRTYIETGRKKVIGIGREVLAQRKDGTTFPVELSVSEMLLPGRRMFTGIVHDITGRKLAEATLREANEKLAAVIETSPVAVVVVDLEGKVQTWNAAAERMFGWPAEEVTGRPIPSVPAEDRETFLESLAMAARGEGVSGVERRRLRKDGTAIDVTLWTAPLRDRDGELSAQLAVFADVTQRKQLEEQLRHAQKMEAVGRLAGGIAHDFNNILTVITGYAEMARDGAARDPQLRGEIDEILTAAEHACALTGQLLVFSRSQVTNQEVLDLNTVVAKLERMLRRIIGEDVELVTVPAADLGLVRADAAQIEQVIMNLAVNARDAMPEGGRLTIETANVELDTAYVDTHMGVSAGDYVMLAVSDNGKGMPPEVRARLFEPFFTTKERGKGTGLGLSTVYGIVKQSCGEIWVYSEPGQGTTFKIYLPRAAEPEEAERRRPQDSRPLERGAETVLLAEDETGVRALVREILRQQGYRVLEALDVEDALRLCREYEGQIDLLLTDVVMPVMSGRELAERAAGIRPGLKVLYMSGYTDNVVVHHGVSAHETQFLQKPFTPKLLARKVRDVLDLTL